MEQNFGFDPTFYLNPKTSFPITFINLSDEYRLDLRGLFWLHANQRVSSKFSLPITSVIDCIHHAGNHTRLGRGRENAMVPVS